MKLYLIATQMVYYVALIPWIFFWGMAFSVIIPSPTSQTAFFFIATTLYPVAVIVCTIIAWYFHLSKRSLSIAINLIPAIWLFNYYIYFFN